MDIDNIKEQWDEHLYANGATPKFADCEIRYLDDKEPMKVIIKLDSTQDVQDNLIFFYCDGLADLLSLCEEDNGEDFVITDFYGFCDTI